MANRLERIHVCVSIDTECDHDPNWVRSDPLTFESIVRGVPELLQPLFDDTGAVPSYLLTVEVMEDEASVAALKALEGNYEFGTHLHAAFVEPQKKYTDYSGVDSPEFQCGYPEEIEYQKLKNLTALFVDNFGYQPLSFRAGRFGASANTTRSLQRLGYRVDSSVTPGFLLHASNAEVDYRNAPLQPYHPSDADIAEATIGSAGDIIEAPVTVKPRLLRKPEWFRPWFSSVDSMKKIIEWHLRKYATRQTLVLNMMFHSMEVIEKASPYPQTPDDVQRYLDDMREVLEWCAAQGFEFTAMGNLPDDVVR